MKKFIFIITILISVTLRAEVKEISFALYNYYPFLLSEGSERGYAFDISREIFEKRGYRVKYEYMPLARAIHETLDLESDVILGLSPIHSNELMYSETPVTSLKFYIWGKNNLNWKYRSKEDLKKVNIVTISGFNYTLADPEYNLYLDSKPSNVTFLGGGKSIERAFMMIYKGRADVFSIDIDQGTAILRSMKLLKDFKRVGELKYLYHGYFGVSKKHPKKYGLIHIFEEGMIKLRKEGTLNSIFDKYRKNFNLINNPFSEDKRALSSENKKGKR